MNLYRAGIDIGSTTVKLVVLDEQGQLVYSCYRRHMAHTQDALAKMLQDARIQLGSCDMHVGMTGSGALALADAMGVDFVQEVVAVAGALKQALPQTDRKSVV